LEIPRG